MSRAFYSDYNYTVYYPFYGGIIGIIEIMGLIIPLVSPLLIAGLIWFIVGSLTEKISLILLLICFLTVVVIIGYYLGSEWLIYKSGASP